jgi:AcrR family transcriptional regulator
LRKLAAEADVNLAIINYFFGSKKKLLTEIHNISFSGYLEIAKTEMADKDDLSVKLHGLIHSAVKYFASHRDYLLVTIAEHKARLGRHLHSKEHNSGIETVPPVIFCSMLTSIMASRSLFTPAMNQGARHKIQKKLNHIEPREALLCVLCGKLILSSGCLLAAGKAKPTVFAAITFDPKMEFIR